MNKEQRQIYNRAYRLNHQEEYKAYGRTYYLKHREERLAYGHAYHQACFSRNRQRNSSGEINDTRESKKCTICKQYFPLSSFTHNRTNWDGFEGFCRECNTARMRRWREKNRERVNEIGRKSMAKYPEKNRARALAHICFPERQECIIKGCEELGERHHNNYANGKDIIWLCRKHHRIMYHLIV